MKQLENFKKLKQEEILSSEWLDSQQVCQLLKISPRTLESYRYKKVLKFGKIGGKIYYKYTDIIKKLESSYNEN